MFFKLLASLPFSTISTFCLYPIRIPFSLTAHDLFFNAKRVICVVILITTR